MGPVELTSQRVVNGATNHHQDAGGERHDAGVVEPSGGGAQTRSETVGHVGVERTGRLNATGVLGHNPANADNTDGGE